MTFLNPRLFRNGRAPGAAASRTASAQVVRPPPRAFISVEEYATPGGATATEDHTEAIQAALADAQHLGKGLYFPPSRWNSSLPLIPTKRIKLWGAGPLSQFKYTGTGAPLRLDFVSADAGEGTQIHDLRFTGTNLEGQSGITSGTNGISPRTLKIEAVHLDGFVGGDGVFLKNAINCEIRRCKIQGARNGIVLRTPCGCSAEKNWINYWANAAIHFLSITGDGLAARCNSATENVIHGDPEQVQDVAQDRAGIIIDGVSTTSIINNYLEDIDEPPSGSFFGHGVWFRRTGAALTQDNTIVAGYYGPNITGDAVRIDSGVSHTSLLRQQLGAYVVRDSGGFTYFDMVHMSDISQRQGTSTTRRGWISLSSGSVVQLHA